MGNAKSKFSEFFRILKEDGLSNAVVEKITQICTTGDVKIACDVLVKELNEFRQSKIKLGIIGVSGAGKSTLINTLRGLEPNQDKAAAVGVNETTTEIQYYTHPDFPRYILSDLPGVGTRKFSKDEYVQTINIEQFSCLIICSHARFTENDIWIAQQAKERRIPYVFVRTKIDFDVQNCKDDQGESFDERKTLDSIRKTIVDNLTESDLPTNAVFLLSCKIKHIDQWDFNDLVEYISQQLPKDAETAFIFSLMAKYSTNVMKRNQLLSRIPQVAMEATLKHCIAGVWAKDALHSEVQFYATQFSLSEAERPDMPDVEEMENRCRSMLDDIASLDLLGWLIINIAKLIRLYEEYKIYLIDTLETCFQKAQDKFDPTKT